MTHAVLRELGHTCPRLRVLRAGGDSATDAALTRALPALLPAVWQPEGPEQHSWEQLDVDIAKGPVGHPICVVGCVLVCSTSIQPTAVAPGQALHDASLLLFCHWKVKRPIGAQ